MCRTTICFFFNDTATTEIYPLSLHDALPILSRTRLGRDMRACEQDQTMASLLGVDVDRTISMTFVIGAALAAVAGMMRSEEHTSELQSLAYLVCRLLLEKKKSCILYHRIRER